jgi:hypothetical protein
MVSILSLCQAIHSVKEHRADPVLSEVTMKQKNDFNGEVQGVARLSKCNRQTIT